MDGGPRASVSLGLISFLPTYSVFSLSLLANTAHAPTELTPTFQTQAAEPAAAQPSVFILKQNNIYRFCCDTLYFW